MPADCYRRTTGGKGNFSRITERDPQICAAGLPSTRPHESVAAAQSQYLLQDEVDALISDAIIPPPPPRTVQPARRPIPLDQRHAVFGNVTSLINPPPKTRFQIMVDDIKETSYASYYKKPLGKPRDPIPMFPEGFDINGTTYGRTFEKDLPLYDLVLPKIPLPDVDPHRRAGYQTCRKYCPSFNPDLTYGHRTGCIPSGILVKKCLTEDKVVHGTGGRIILNNIQADFKDRHQPRKGAVLAPNKNINDVPPGYSFGTIDVDKSDTVQQCITRCKMNPDRVVLKECLAHINSLRIILAGRHLMPSYFRNLSVELKYYDCEKSGWLPKQVVYDYCGTKRIRLNPSLIEPFLQHCNWFDGENIKYKEFIFRVLNFREPIVDLPKVPDVQPDCLDYRTTYSEMTKPGQVYEGGHRMAGKQCGGYLESDYPVITPDLCSAHRACLGNESDMYSCVSPSVLTQFSVSHRDMYQPREPGVVRRVFEATGEEFTDERFSAIWENAKKYHSQGLVCYETFRRALKEESQNDTQKHKVPFY